MALASLGALACMGVTATVNRSMQRDFAREWIDSLRVKDPRPLGEEAIRRMRQSGPWLPPAPAWVTRYTAKVPSQWPPS